MKILGIILAVVVLTMCTAPVFADDPGIVVEVNVVGDYPDAYVNLYGNDPDVFVNGQGLDKLAAEAGAGAGASAAMTFGTPNGQWSSASTGMLPPLATLEPELNQIAPGKYSQPLVGWIGYFCPTTNLVPSVYKGAGCGGAWGVADGYPDLWTRRQIAGLAPKFYLQQEKLNMSMVALSKLIAENGGQNTEMLKLASQIQEQVDEITVTNLSVSVLEEENNVLHKELNKQLDQFNQILLALCVVVFFLVVSMVIVAVKLSKRG